MKIVYALLFVFIAIWMLLFHPYEVGKNRPSQSQLYLSQFIYKEFDTNKTRVELHGFKGRYIDERFVVDMPTLYDRAKGERLEALEGTYEGGIVVMRRRVHYSSPQMQVRAKLARYDTHKAILRIPSPFELRKKDLLVHGKDLVYYESSGKIVAFDIDAKVWTR